MNVASMTGFARADGVCREVAWTWGEERQRSRPRRAVVCRRELEALEPLAGSGSRRR
ncbi:MAG: hypothetical protein U1E33_01405 [Rhodospirillales bacterium]